LIASGTAVAIVSIQVILPAIEGIVSLLRHTAYAQLLVEIRQRMKVKDKTKTYSQASTQGHLKKDYQSKGIILIT
jgi:hypothetical protein